jgi:hypothetical protein
MRRKPVTSSMMRSVGYDPARSILEIEFRTGETYDYFAVPASTARALMSAESKGQFFHQSIDGVYPFAKATH